MCRALRVEFGVYRVCRGNGHQQAGVKECRVSQTRGLRGFELLGLTIFRWTGCELAGL